MTCASSGVRHFAAPTVAANVPAWGTVRAIRCTATIRDFHSRYVTLVTTRLTPTFIQRRRIPAPRSKDTPPPTALLGAVVRGCVKQSALSP